MCCLKQGPSECTSPEWLYSERQITEKRMVMRYLAQLEASFSFNLHEKIPLPQM